ncbi:MAG: DUF7507 domain-containing protein [Protaetiibacter sp.]
MDSTASARSRAHTTTRASHRLGGRARTRGTRGTGVIAASLAAVLVGSGLAAWQATPAWAAFPTNEAIVYLAQGDGGTPVRTQLMQGLQSNGQITFSDIGQAHTGPQYNAIGFNEQDGYLYGVRASTGAGQTPKVVRIGPAGGVTVVKDAVVGSVTGAFGAVANRFYYFSDTNLFYTDVTAPAGGTTTVPLSGSVAGGMPADVTFANGYFWGYLGSGQMVRIGPGGGVTRFTVPAMAGHTAAGGAFTYGNGNLGFSKNAGGIVQVRVTNPASAAPTFSIVSVIAGPASSSNDAASSLGDPSDLAITKSASVSEATRGQSFTYTLSVRNNGAGVSSGFTVSDAIPSHLAIGALPTGCERDAQTVTCSGGRLTVGAVSTFSIPVTVSATAPRGTLTNTSTVLGNEADPVASNNSGSVDVRILVPALSLVKSAAIDGGGDAVEGADIAYTFVVTNTGDLPLSGVQIADPLVTGISPSTASIDVGESVTFTSSLLRITQAHVDDGAVDNTATATGTAGGQTVSASASATVPIPQQPGLTALKSAEIVADNGNGVADEGEDIRYTIRVENTGNVTLVDVGVTDPKLPGLTATVTLAPGAVYEFQGVYRVTAADVVAGEVVNSATAHGTPPSGPPIQTPPTTTTTETVDVGISLVKSADWPGSATNAAAQVGDEVTFHFVVTNTGNVALDDVTIDDPMVDGRTTVSPASGMIAPGGQLIFQATITVGPGDIVDGEVANTATAWGTPVGGTRISSAPASTTIPLAAATPAIALEKRAQVTDTNGNGFADVGELITYSMIATNTGNVTITDVQLVDPMFGPGQLWPDTGFASLLPGEQGVFGGQYTVRQTDVDAGVIHNTATVHADDPWGGDLTDAAFVDVTTVPAAPALTLVKTSALVDANGNGVADEGETIEYRFVVRNTGNVTLDGIMIDDPMLGALTISGALAPGASTETTSTYLVRASDLSAPEIVNTATAQANAPGGTPISSDPSSTRTETARPALTIDKSDSLFDADGSGAAGIGETITYSFEVVNTGNTRLENVRVVDDRVTGVSPASITLEVGDSYVFTAAYTVTEADILAGSIVNTARAEGTVPGGSTPTRSADDSVTTPTDPVIEALAIVKSAELADTDGDTLADLGELITYRFTVENVGNVTITGITISDSMVTGLPAPFTLAPGERRTVSADPYTVTQADIDDGGVVNTASATGTGPGGPVPSDPSTVTVETPPRAPALTLVKSVANPDGNGNGVADETEQLEYTFVVVNTGNVTLDNVAIDDPMLSGATSPDSGPLAPGASRTFMAAYVVQAGDISSPNGDGAIVNRAVAVADAPGGAPVRSSVAAASVPVAAPGLAIEKSAAFADDDGDGMAGVGEIATFTFVVTNTGNTVLSGVEVRDPRIGVTLPIGVLEVGASVTVTADYLVTEADIVAQELVNSARATGVIPGVPPTPVESPESVTSVPLGPDVAEIALRKEAVLDDADDDGLADPGESIVYRFTITNTGNRTVTDIEVSDPMIAALLPGAITRLLPGESATVEADPHIVADGDFADGQIRNVARASGLAPAGQVTSQPATAVVMAPDPVAAPVLGDTGADVRMLAAVALIALGLGGAAVAATWRVRRRVA